MNDGAPGNPLTDRRHGARLGRKHLCKRPTAALAHRHDGLPVARLVLREPPIDSIGSQVFGSYVATEIGAIDLRGSSIAADNQRLCGRRHSFAQFVSQYERCLVLDIEVAREGEHAFAFYLITKDGNGHEVGFERKFMPGKQGT